MPKKKEDSTSIPTLDTKSNEAYILTGIEEIDELLGGFARGRITELWGAEGVGKTHLASLFMANISKTLKVLYVDSEYALNKARVEALGAVSANIAYLADSRLENVAEATIKAVGSYDVIILDSLAQLTPMAVANSEVGERAIGLFALLIKHWVLKIRPKLASSKTALIILNQYRPPIGLYATEQPPGGMAFRHVCDIRIKLSKGSADRILEDGKLVGHWVNLEVKKNRLGQPGLKTKTKIMY